MTVCENLLLFSKYFACTHFLSGFNYFYNNFLKRYIMRRKKIIKIILLGVVRKLRQSKMREFGLP